MTSKYCVDLLFHALYSNSSSHSLLSVLFCCHIDLLSAGEMVACGNAAYEKILSECNNFCFCMLYLLLIYRLVTLHTLQAVFVLARLIQNSNYNIINNVSKKSILILHNQVSFLDHQLLNVHTRI